MRSCIRILPVAFLLSCASQIAEEEEDVGGDDPPPTGSGGTAGRGGTAGSPPRDAAAGGAGVDARPTDGPTADAPGPATEAGRTEVAPSADAPPAITGLAPYLPDPVTLGMGLPRVVPVLWIEVGGKAIAKGVQIPGKLKVFADHDNTHRDLATRTPTLETKVGFQGRGNYTWTLPKKGYSFELQDDAGNDVALPLLGMPKGSDWALYACYSDKTCLRNAIVSAVGQELGQWSPRARFVELYIDGQYYGLYNLWERVRRDKDRVAIPRPAATRALGDVTGGYVIRHEGAGKGTEAGFARDWTSPNMIKYTYHLPRHDEITAEQKSYIQGYFTNVESVFKAKGDYRALIDFRTWADHAIVQELTNNWDGYVHSVFMIKQSDTLGGKLFMGPLWDYDLAFANGNVSVAGWPGLNCRIDTWSYKNPRMRWDDVPFYWLQLLTADPAFQKEMKCRWAELRKGPIQMAKINAMIDAWVPFTAEARKRDQAKWMTVGKNIFPNCTPPGSPFKTYEEEVAWLRKWIDDRMKWLDANLPGTCP